MEDMVNRWQSLSLTAEEEDVYGVIDEVLEKDIKRKLMELDKELDGALALDEFNWKQRSRVEWLKGGDRGMADRY
ncbi:hypothetical protein TIFTF001_017703 [Ficus carica]|uniref:Uncharacterized protein n=1 Tax=Ficus carica TaxID=3494 RepID=A0AA88A8I4_FICCA|nr:hypothetical protein TIFTF001_017703 [Ficus carica]